MWVSGTGLIGAVLEPGEGATLIVGLSVVNPAECAYVRSVTIEYAAGSVERASTWETSYLIEPMGMPEDACASLHVVDD